MELMQNKLFENCTAVKQAWNAWCNISFRVALHLHAI